MRRGGIARLDRSGRDIADSAKALLLWAAVRNLEGDGGARVDGGKRRAGRPSTTHRNSTAPAELFGTGNIIGMFSDTDAGRDDGDMILSWRIVASKPCRQYRRKQAILRNYKLCKRRG